MNGLDNQNMESTKEKRDRLLQIIKAGAYFREKIILSSGKESDYYIDARLITLTAEGASLCAALMLEAVNDLKYDAIGGPTLGADPLIGAINVLSFQAGKPLNTFIIRQQAKAHGKGKMVEGPPLKSGAQVVIIDDVATTGKAFVHSIDVLTQMNIKVLKALCIVDRGEGAKEAVAQKGCELLSIFKATEIHTG